MSHLELFYHLVCVTWRREPFITADVEEQIHLHMAHKVTRQKGYVHAINGMPDHVHIVLSIPPTVAISIFVKNVKGATSRYTNSQIVPGFKWQAGYGLRTLSKDHLGIAIAYVRHQKRHHAENNLKPELEEISPDFMEPPDYE